MSDTEPTMPQQVLTNAERLRAHLSKDSLAAVLLSAWEAGEAAGAQDRLQAALATFHTPQPAGEHDRPAE